MYILKLAFRNIGRNRRRSLLAALSVLLALFLMVFMEGLLNGMLTSITLNATKSDSGHVLIETADYQHRARFMPADANIQDPASVTAALTSDPKVGPLIDFTAERIRFGTLISLEGRSARALGIGGDLQTEKRLLMLDRSIVQGRYPQGGREALIGSGLADALKAGIGTVLKIQAGTSEGSTDMRKFTVVGIFRTGLDTLDANVIQVPLADAQILTHSGEGAQQILVMLKDYRQADKAAGLIAAALARGEAGRGLSVIPWSRSSDLFGFLTMASSMFSAIYLFIALLGTIIIVNIMMMVVLERRHEIGIMKAMGISRGEILGIFTAEGFVLGLIGSVGGIILGLAITAVTGKTGINLGDAVKGMSVPMSSVIRPAITAGGAVKVFVIGVLVSGLISILPARRAARMDAVSAMKTTM